MKRLLHLIKSGNHRILFQGIRKRWNSTHISLGLQRDLQVPFKAPDAKIPIHIRHIQNSDIENLLINSSLRKENLKLYDYQMSLLDAFFSNCFVAENIKGEACYMQFLIGPQKNKKIQQHFGGTFPLLGSEEALLEGIFMNSESRGLAIMPAAMSRIAEKAKQFGARWVITFVDKENIATLKSCMRAGFTPYIVRTDRWFLFRMKSHFAPLNDEIMTEYYKQVGPLPEQKVAPANYNMRKAALVNGSV